MDTEAKTIARHLHEAGKRVFLPAALLPLACFPPCFLSLVPIGLVSTLTHRQTPIATATSSTSQFLWIVQTLEEHRDTRNRAQSPPGHCLGHTRDTTGTTPGAATEAAPGHCQGSTGKLQHQPQDTTVNTARQHQNSKAPPGHWDT